MKHNSQLLITAAVILSAPLLFVQCSENASPVQPGTSAYHQDAVSGIMDLDSFPVDPLSEEEAAGLVFMREEEKLARDVYAALFNQWNLPVFSNISASEDMHTDAIKVLIDRYELVDPVADDQPGVFADSDLAELYSALLETGTSSLIEGLRVGAAIEEIDILDLQHQLDSVVDNEDIAFVYKNLMLGSQNHLRAFVTTLARMGVVYTPQYLDSRQYDEIIASGQDRGGRGRGRR